MSICMRKVLLIICLLGMANSVPAGSGDSPIVRIAPSVIASPPVGGHLEIALEVTSAQGVAGFQAVVSFNTAALRYVESANGDFLPQGAFFVTPVVTANRIQLAATSLSGESNGSGTLATLTFEVLSVRRSTVTLSDVILVDSEGVPTNPTLENGQIVETIQTVEDVNRDGVVNIFDLVFVANRLGAAGRNDADVNGDRVVNIIDLVLVASSLSIAAQGPAAVPLDTSLITGREINRWLEEAQKIDLTQARLLKGVLDLFPKR